ncbi:hypothetical protein FS749_016643 [Ceratobasidium sp. UAMH 11750]|nr:hypothetical protein FS749_016643 [Ceratobasidium sp. UAMH 11750]
MSQHPVPPADRIHHHIENITLGLTNPKYPISLKVLVDNVEVFRLPEIARGQTLHWARIPPCDVSRESEVTIRVYEMHKLGRKLRVASVRYGVSSVEGQREAKIGSDNPLYTATIVFLNPQPVSRPTENMTTTQEGDAAATALAQARAQAAHPTRRPPHNLGPARDVIEKVLGFGNTVAGIHPTLGILFELCDTAWQKLEAQEQCDECVERLLAGLSSIHPLVAAVETAVKLPHLQSTVKVLFRLIEDASRFITDYHTEGGIEQPTGALAGSTPQTQVDEWLQKLQSVKEEFKLGIAVQTLLEGQPRLLDQLKPLYEASYDISRACLDGTRKEIISDITTWCESSNDSERLLWVHGHAGLGKSTIATSVCQKLDGLNMLAASFFCKRDDKERRNPQKVLTTAIHGLARCQPAYAEALTTLILQNNSICGSPSTENQYNKLVVDLSQLPKVSAATRRLVIVVDALDECGDEQTRRRLLTQLHGMSRAFGWLRIVITSRPDRDIKRSFSLASRDHVLATRDVQGYSATDDILAYVRHRFQDSPEADLLPDDAESQLAEKAGGLFIWAYTACELILDSTNPRARFDTLLETTRVASTRSALEILYDTAIEASVGKGGSDNIEDVQRCLGFIIACSSRTPLSISTLCEVLGDRIEQDVLKNVVSRLGSVLYIDQSQGETVRVYHPSFADYISTRAASERFYLNLSMRNAELAEGCMETMVDKLEFNICNLETSYVRNKDIPDLDLSAITDGLRYSSEYWITHLVQIEKRALTSHAGALLNQILNEPRVLYWVEALSLIGKLNTALSSARDLRRWCGGTPELGIVNDLERFIQIFYVPISESTPHLYISRLAFLPIRTSLAELRKQHFVNTMKVLQGGQETWSSLRHCVVLESGVNSVAFSPDGHRIVSGSSDNAVRVWDADTGAPIGDPLTSHSSYVKSVAFSPNGHRIVSGSSDETVRVWDAHTGAPIGEPITGHSTALHLLRSLLMATALSLVHLTRQCEYGMQN